MDDLKELIAIMFALGLIFLGIVGVILIALSPILVPVLLVILLLEK